MDAAPAAPARRRRGEELEGALLDAAWQELQATGYGGLTFEGVATRARTSKPVLYRRWPTKADLVVAAMKQAGLFERRELPDTGSLREDVLVSLRNFNDSRADFITAIGLYLASIASRPASRRRTCANASSATAARAAPSSSSGRSGAGRCPTGPTRPAW